MQSNETMTFPFLLLSGISKHEHREPKIVCLDFYTGLSLTLSLIGTLQSAQTFPCPEAYLEPSRTSAMEPLCENSELAVNYFRKKASS